MKKGAAENFIPFEPQLEPASAASGPQLKVMPKAEARPGFSPLPTPPTLSVHGSHGAAAGGGVPLVTLQREGDRVTTIRIECQCGQVIELACSY